MVQTQQPVLELAPGVSHNPVILPKTDAFPACAEPGNEPGWWDTDTHEHDNNWRCQDCAIAVAICADCPLRLRCLRVGMQVRQPSLIYGGATFTPAGRVPNCLTCDNPVPVRSGKISTIPTCSNPCSRGLRRKIRHRRVR
jgi:hypothetical protein